ncbi:MAG: DUF3365 domain-containing protein [Gammaproteobacteria bacterium]|nr:DUF3365 domain-containing protein [Gammaproteobacteria bacterium]NIR84513.1 DUF3365 domain-containing protein [Gammaproteobacteria bacterium]NIR90416.1 DUF3365 domain-containing protein [Gammaproteobacteria bacterium]NIU05564.1 DUF3365 domain-containing protein [Gammaproteobacteria bacterium]NIV52703.1 DUF3365 domain-containing protein [Gammaproteobacteria bacterium]
MRRVLSMAVFGGLLAAPLWAGEVTEQAAASRAIVAEFAQGLKAELQAAMQSGGAVSAIQVCNTRAPDIARRAGESFGGRVERTSLRVRNPDNAPDPWERAVLEAFERRQAAGEDPAQLEHFEVVEADGRRVFRYMKAIPTAGLCLTCHGSALAPNVVQALDRLYPRDRARGFEVGDIRGAFSIEKPM